MREVAVEGRAARFDAKGIRHHHFICDRCGDVEDIEWYDVPRPASASLGKRILANATRIVAIELLAAAQGLEYLKPLTPGRGVARTYAAVRREVKPLDGDRPLTGDIERVAVGIREGKFDPEKN